MEYWILINSILIAILIFYKFKNKGLATKQEVNEINERLEEYIEKEKKYKKEIQEIIYLSTKQITYIFQQGIPEWKDDQDYYRGSLTKEPDGGLNLYQSLTDNNVGNQLTDIEHWKRFPR